MSSHNMPASAAAWGGNSTGSGDGQAAGQAAGPGGGPVRVRMFRIFGRRSSSSQPCPSHSRPGQEAARDDQDSTDSDENPSSASRDRDSSYSRESPSRDRCPNRRARSKKQPGGGSAGSSDCHGSSSSGDGFRSASCSSNCQMTESSSDSGSSKGDNSPGTRSAAGAMGAAALGAALGACMERGSERAHGMETGMSSDSGSSGSSGSELGGSMSIFQTCLQPLNAFGASGPSSRSNSCFYEGEVRRPKAGSSTLHKVFHGLSLSTQAIMPLSRRSQSSSCLSLGDSLRESLGLEDSHRGRPHSQHHHHHHHYQHHHHHHHYQLHHSSYALNETGAPPPPPPLAAAAALAAAPAQAMRQDGDAKKGKRSKKVPKRILRSPVTYTYVRGISGLPTQRVPRNLLPPQPPGLVVGHGYRKPLSGGSIFGAELSRHAYNS